MEGKKTPLYSAHLECVAKVVEFGVGSCRFSILALSKNTMQYAPERGSLMYLTWESF